MGTKKLTDEQTSAAFNVTKQEEIAKKEIHIVGQRVKYYREKLGMEQMALAEMLGVKSNAISNWEHGRTRPDLNQIPKICKALGIGFYELFGVDDPLRTFSAFSNSPSGCCLHSILDTSILPYFRGFVQLLWEGVLRNQVLL